MARSLETLQKPTNLSVRSRHLNNMANCPEDLEVNCKTWSSLSSFTKSILESQKEFLELTFSGKKIKILV